MTRIRPIAVVTLAVCLATLFASPHPAAAQQRSFEEVVAQLKSPEARTRQAAVRMLAESGYPEAALPVAPLLADPDERVAREAVYAELGLFLGTRVEGERRVAAVVQIRNGNPAARAFDGGWGVLPLDPVPPAVTRGMIAPGASPELTLRLEATYALALLAQIEGTPAPEHQAVAAALAERLGDREPAARAAAARAAGRVFRRCAAPCTGVDRERLGDALVRSLNDPDADVLMAVIEGLGEMRYERGAQPLTDFYNYQKKGPLALASLDALARIGQPESVPVFRAALTRKEPAALRAAVEGLARAGDKESVASAAIALGRERNAEVSLGLAFAQQRLGQAQQLDRLIQAAGERASSLQAQDYLVELGPSVAGQVAGVLPAASAEGRLRLVEVLGVIGGAEQLPALQAAQRDGPSATAAASERAVRRVKAFGK